MLHHNPGLLTLEQACDFLGGDRPLSRTTFWRGIRDGHFPKAVQIGNSKRWLKSELAAVIERAAAARPAVRS